ncbi:hypothetical protein [Pseudonocardia pini]|uniref:hypothetical protein n=1 Tax=Pseudonocardia pini TaxID=2758030 RepID=UPI0028B01322|nr:hypothetical protein [Pseudonocardia pini]
MADIRVELLVLYSEQVEACRDSGSAERTAGRLRLGLTVRPSERFRVGEHKLTDPDGRVVVVRAAVDSSGRALGPKLGA